jgi:hypothetical protein
VASAPSLTARVVMSESDEPACGSDKHMVPNQRPSTKGRAKVSICPGKPKVAKRRAFATVSIG